MTISIGSKRINKKLPDKAQVATCISTKPLLYSRKCFDKNTDRVEIHLTYDNLEALGFEPVQETEQEKDWIDALAESIYADEDIETNGSGLTREKIRKHVEKCMPKAAEGNDNSVKEKETTVLRVKTLIEELGHFLSYAPVERLEVTEEQKKVIRNFLGEVAVGTDTSKIYDICAGVVQVQLDAHRDGYSDDMILHLKNTISIIKGLGKSVDTPHNTLFIYLIDSPLGRQ